MKHKDYFPGVVGLEGVKRHLTFLIHSYEHTGFINNLLFVARYGSGKTLICRNIANNLLNSNNKPKKLIEINCATLRSVTSLMDQIILPHVIDQEVTLFLDEIDFADIKVIHFLHSLLAYDPKTKKSHFSYGGTNYTIKFQYGLTVLATTTNAEQLPRAIVNRFYRLSISDYKVAELSAMLKKYCPDINFLNGVDKEIIDTCRQNPRHIALRIGNNISNYLIQKKFKHNNFGSGEWNELRRIIGIMPKGVTNDEYKLLKGLVESPLTLTAISSKLNLDPSSVRQDVEHYLLSNSYIRIDGKRYITDKGIGLLGEIQAWEAGD